MPLSTSQCESLIQHTLNTQLGDEIDAMFLINQAGNYLVGLEPWNWLLRPPTSINLSAGQEYVSLPTDFGRAIHVQVNPGLTNTFNWTTIDQITNLRSTGINIGSLEYWGAIATPAIAATGVYPDPRLELYPTPASTVVGGLKIVYRARWKTQSGPANDSDYIPIPEYMEPLYTQILRAFARGLEEEDDASLSKRLAEIQMGPMYSAASRMDAEMQADYGQILNGAIARRSIGLDPGYKYSSSRVPVP